MILVKDNLTIDLRSQSLALFREYHPFKDIKYLTKSSPASSLMSKAGILDLLLTDEGALIICQIV
jgi:hypothetical protein